MKSVRFILAIHNHQPVGNFDHVFRKACDKAYHPFLDVLDDFPDIPVVLHFSGPLLEWIEQNDRSLVTRIQDGVRAGRFELLGGGYGEPILTMLPLHDAAGQIRMLREHIAARYGTNPRGIWLSERVWESHLASLLVDTGVEYTVVDDFHFLATGLRQEDLTGYFTVEDQGRVLRVFPGSERLRYVIPFGKPADTLGLLRRFSNESGDNVVVYADDGEKFGLWPETYEHVYGTGWLRDFFRALSDNRDWVRFATFAETVDSLPPVGRAYLPDASYREMTEWSLRGQAREELELLLRDLAKADLLERCRPFIRGGTWRNFKAKYTEAAQMYARMLETSSRIGERAAARRCEEALRELYRAQCNCAYWHGVFAGLYMPFLRSAVYSHLLSAEALVATRRSVPERIAADLDLDGLPEVKLAAGALAAYLKPDRGGTLYELDCIQKRLNLCNVMTRRREAYHARLVEAAKAANQPPSASGGARSIHERVRWKEPGLEKLLFYDPLPRDSLLDRFLPRDVDPRRLRERRVEEIGDFAGRPYRMHLDRSRAATVTFDRTGAAGPPGAKRPLILAKRINLTTEGVLAVRYALQFPEGAPPATLFAVEMNLALSAVDEPDRKFLSSRREPLGTLATEIHLRAQPALCLADEWLGVEAWLRVEPSADFIAYPVETVNDSEDGFERIRQGTCVMACWSLEGESGEERVFALEMEVRTS